MVFTETGLAGAYVVEMEMCVDERGFFARSWCAREFADKGLEAVIAQCNASFNRKKGTLRGMHYQHPHAEAKLIRCTQGSLFDAIIDLRPGSATFKRHFAIELNARNRKMLYAPRGFAHGFLTLEDDTEISYQMSEFYHPGEAFGVRWNDPAFSIPWPIAVDVIADKDRDLPDFRAQA